MTRQSLQTVNNHLFIQYQGGVCSRKHVQLQIRIAARIESRLFHLVRGPVFHLVRDGVADRVYASLAPNPGLFGSNHCPERRKHG